VAIREVTKAQAAGGSPAASSLLVVASGKGQACHVRHGSQVPRQVPVALRTDELEVLRTAEAPRVASRSPERHFREALRSTPSQSKKGSRTSSPAPLGIHLSSSTFNFQPPNLRTRQHTSTPDDAEAHHWEMFD
jgi:hypothetical protein